MGLLKEKTMLLYVKAQIIIYIII